ncbi:MAG: helix-turn-helix domain-containing protein [Calditrichaeota bacterium]|nr:helix-turn-helix domain-containing protein [Calditrichota bacterium]
MKSIGELLRRARTRRRLSLEEVAGHIGVDAQTLSRWEEGDPELEKWGKILADLAIQLSVPTSRLISETGRSSEARPGQCGARIRALREARGVTASDLASGVGLSTEEYERVEAGESPLEEIAPRLLKMAELVDLPVFNLLYGY